MIAFKKILIAIDFSPQSEHIVNFAVSFGGKWNANLTILYVVEALDAYGGFAVPHISISRFENELRESARRKMVNFIEEHQPGHVAFDSVILSGNVAERITSYAEKDGSDLIILGTHGPKGLAKTLFGSVADTVLKTSPCPVITVTPSSQPKPHRHPARPKAQPGMPAGKAAPH